MTDPNPADLLPRYHVEGIEFRDAQIVVHYALPENVEHPIVKEWTTMTVVPVDELDVEIRELFEAVYALIDAARPLKHSAPERIPGRPSRPTRLPT